jgi:hypothetical protein
MAPRVLGPASRRRSFLPLPGVPLPRDPRSRESNGRRRGHDAYLRRRARHRRFVSVFLYANRKITTNLTFSQR